MNLSPERETGFYSACLQAICMLHLFTRFGFTEEEISFALSSDSKLIGAAIKAQGKEIIFTLADNDFGLSTTEIERLWKEFVAKHNNLLRDNEKARKEFYEEVWLHSVAVIFAERIVEDIRNAGILIPALPNIPGLNAQVQGWGLA